MKARLFGAVALFMLPTLAIAADAGSGPTNGATSTKDAGSGPTPGAKPGTGSADSTGVTTGQKSARDSTQPDNAKAAGTGGGEGAAAPTTTSNSGATDKMGAHGAAATSQGAAGNENKPANTESAGDGGGQGSKMKPEKTP